MSARAYYNEIDPRAAAWLRELIAARVIAPGEVDERSIVDVTAGDLAGFTQCHFFAGIGVWSYALRRAGWPDDRPVWSGSCPCQPFSDAGAQGGFDDPRHLWPAWFRIIRERRPGVVFGEQVASKAGLVWLDLVSADVEDAGYAIGTADLCAAGVGAPHIRQRFYWVADTDDAGRGKFGAAWLHAHGEAGNDAARRGETGLVVHAAGERQHTGSVRGTRSETTEERSRRCESAESSRVVGMADSDGSRLPQRERGESSGAPIRADGGDGADNCGAARGLADAGCDGDRQHPRELSGNESEHDIGSANGDHASVDCGATRSMADASSRGLGEFGDAALARRSGHVDGGILFGFWRDADWIYCRDEKWRPVEPGTFPLAHGAPARVGRLRGYGNALNAETAIAFIEAYCDVRGLYQNPHAGEIVSPRASCEAV